MSQSAVKVYRENVKKMKISGGGNRLKRKTFTFDFQEFETMDYPLLSGAGREIFGIFYGSHNQSECQKVPISLWDKDQKNGEVKYLKA